MLDANTPAFREQYPNGAIVRDRLGRQLRGAEACNPETGEVWTYDKNPDGSFQFLGGCLTRRINHHPAPLTIEPRQWLHIGFDNH